WERPLGLGPGFAGGIEFAEAFEVTGDFAVRFAEGFAVHAEGFEQEIFGLLAEFAAVFHLAGEIDEGDGGARMVGAEDLLLDSKGLGVSLLSGSTRARDRAEYDERFGNAGIFVAQ